MKLSLVIAFYKNTAALGLIFRALARQSYPHFEVIVAEDDHDPAAFEFITNARSAYSFPIQHLRQERDEGFRKNQMLNRSIRAAQGEVLVFLDGDCIPHRHFLKEHAQSATEGVAAFGRRVMLSESLTHELLHSQHLDALTFPGLLRSGSQSLKYGLYLPFLTNFRETGIWGCNWSVLKKHLLAVNGFDEDYVRAGIGEDIDVEWRLVQTGIRLKSIRFGAIVYHLYHRVNYGRADVEFNTELFHRKQAERALFCRNGLNSGVTTHG